MERLLGTSQFLPLCSKNCLRIYLQHPFSFQIELKDCPIQEALTFSVVKRGSTPS